MPWDGKSIEATTARVRKHARDDVWKKIGLARLESLQEDMANDHSNRHTILADCKSTLDRLTHRNTGKNLFGDREQVKRTEAARADAKITPNAKSIPAKVPTGDTHATRDPAIDEINLSMSKMRDAITKIASAPSDQSGPQPKNQPRRDPAIDEINLSMSKMRDAIIKIASVSSDQSGKLADVATLLAESNHDNMTSLQDQMHENHASQQRWTADFSNWTEQLADKIHNIEKLATGLYHQAPSSTQHAETRANASAAALPASTGLVEGATDTHEKGLLIDVMQGNVEMLQGMSTETNSAAENKVKQRRRAKKIQTIVRETKMAMETPGISLEELRRVNDKCEAFLLR